jgi:hypothetical protein
VELHIVKVGDDLVNARWWFCSGLFGEYCLDEQIVWFKEQHLIGLVSSKSARMNGAIVARSLTVNHDAMTFKFIYVNKYLNIEIVSWRSSVTGRAAVSQHRNSV